MAKVGLKYPVFAPIQKETNGAPVTYGAGVIFGKAISANVSFNRSTSTLYADDAKAEADNSVTGGTISFTVDQVSDAGKKAAFGYNLATDENGDVTYDITGDATPYGGFGYIEVLRQGGVNLYRANWIHKIQFGMQEMTAETKGENIAWQTESVSGDVMAVYPDATGKQYFVAVHESRTEANAWEWLKTKANVSASMPE